MLASAQVVETSVNTNNSPSQDYTTNPDDHSNHNKNFVYTCVQILHFRSTFVSFLGMSEYDSQVIDIDVLLQNIKMHRAKMQKQNKQRTSTSSVPRWLTNDAIDRQPLFPLKPSGKSGLSLQNVNASEEQMRREKNRKTRTEPKAKLSASRPE